jgi:2'-5' RNA ligase
MAPVPRPFRAHITLARLRNVEIAKLTDILARRALLRTRPFVVEEFLLYSSRPRTGGGPYVVEEAFRLRGARPDDATFDLKR